MKRLLLSSVAFAALAVGPALAADLPRKAPVYMPPPPPFSWTGFYVGASLGGIAQGTDVGYGPIPIGSGAVNSASVSGFGVIGGGNIGYNWQFAPNWVLGVEADISGTSLNDTTCVECFDGGAGTDNITFASRLNALGTVRARFGYAWDRALIYATGGWAYGHVKDEARWFASTFTTSDTWRSGWTVGGGVEYAFLPHWTVRAETLYVDLGETDVVSSGCRFGFKNHYLIGRLGLNYKF